MITCKLIKIRILLLFLLKLYIYIYMHIYKHIFFLIKIIAGASELCASLFKSVVSIATYDLECVL